MSKKLTDKQRRFVEEYCSNGFNATRAAISAGYSKKTADRIGSDTLGKVDVQKYVEEFMNRATERALCTTEDVVRGLMLEAQCNGEGSSQSARVAAWKALSDYTGGFDANKKQVEHSGTVPLTIILSEDED